MTLDSFDKKILTLLQKNNQISQRAMSEQVNLSASAINRRIAAMEKMGVIKNSITLVDSRKVGRPITIITEVSIENERLDLIEEIKKRFINCPQIQQVYYVTGNFDFLLVLCVRDMDEYEALTRELFFASGNVKSFQTIVSMQNAKQELSVFLD